MSIGNCHFHEQKETITWDRGLKDDTRTRCQTRPGNLFTPSVPTYIYIATEHPQPPITVSQAQKEAKLEKKFTHRKGTEKRTQNLRRQTEKGHSSLLRRQKDPTEGGFTEH